MGSILLSQTCEAEIVNSGSCGGSDMTDLRKLLGHDYCRAGSTRRRLSIKTNSRWLVEFRLHEIFRDRWFREEATPPGSTVFPLRRESVESRVLAQRRSFVLVSEGANPTAFNVNTSRSERHDRQSKA